MYLLVYNLQEDFFMIIVEMCGLDQFVVGNLSKELTPLVAKLYEVDENEVVFLSPQTMVFHKGVEQTSWNIIIKVEAPEQFARVQDKMADLLLHGIGEVAIHVNVVFSYYSADDFYKKVNDDYPLYITEANLVDLEEEDDEFDDDDEEDEEEDIYTGDIFKGLDK